MQARRPVGHTVQNKTKQKFTRKHEKTLGTFFSRNLTASNNGLRNNGYTLGNSADEAFPVFFGDCVLQCYTFPIK